MSLTASVAPSPPTRLAIPGPPGAFVARASAVSPDGRTLALQAGQVGRFQSYLRRLDEQESVALSESEDTWVNAFSPDGQWLLLSDFASYPIILKRLPVGGGPAVTIGEFPDLGASWGPGNTILLGSNEGLWTMPVSGNERSLLTTISEGESGHYSPQFLPDGRAVLFYIHAGHRDEAQIAVYDFDADERRTLIAGTSPRYVSSGHLVFWRQEALWAVPFDSGQLEVTGDPLPIVENVPANGLGFVAYVVTHDGTLFYTSDAVTGVRSSLVWVDREGNEEALAADPRNYRSVQLSPQEDRVTVTVLDQGSPATEVLIHDLARGTLSPLTYHEGGATYPTWTPDGTHVLFGSTRDGAVANIYRKAADGTGQVERLTMSANPQGPLTFSPDGRLIFVEVRPDTSADVGLLSMDGEASIEWLLEESSFEAAPALSPDGRWIAYVSDETGQFEVQVRPYPNVHDGNWPISSGGGVLPLWGKDSSELFYLTPDQDGVVTVMMTQNDTDPTFNPGTPRRLFEGVYRSLFPNNRSDWDITSDGERFLMIKPVPSGDSSTAAHINVVLNWTEELQARVPVP